MRTCVSRASGDATTFVRRCVERRRRTTRRPSAGPSAAARAGGPRRGRARARRWSARARRRGRARLHDAPRRLHDPAPRPAPASSSADGGWLCLLAKLGMGGQPRRALLRRGRGATGESLTQRLHAAARRAPRFLRTTRLVVRCDEPSAREGAGGQGGKEESGEALGDTFRYAWLSPRFGAGICGVLRRLYAAPKPSLVALVQGKDVFWTACLDLRLVGSAEGVSQRTECALRTATLCDTLHV